MVESPFETNPVSSRALKGIHCYSNTGTNVFVATVRSRVDRHAGDISQAGTRLRRVCEQDRNYVFRSALARSLAGLQHPLYCVRTVETPPRRYVTEDES